MRLFVLGVLTLFSIQLSAKEINPEIKMAAKNFYLNQVEALNNPILNLSASVKRHCEPVEKTSCIKELCKHKNCGVYGEDIAEICGGVDEECVIELCKSKNCNVYWDDVAQACGGN